MPRALGSVIPKLCVVNEEEIRRFNKMQEDEIEQQSEAARGRSGLQREMRSKQIRVNWAFLRLVMWNARSFQQSLRFEILKIDPSKSALDYEPHEQLSLELIDEATAMRWRLFGWQASFLLRAAFGLAIDHQILMIFVAAYKQLELEMVNLASMADNDIFRQMLIQRLGLDRWDVIDGGSSPAA
jgi:hypothetical protein